MKFIISTVTVILGVIAYDFFNFYGAVIVCIIGTLIHNWVEKFEKKVRTK